MRWPTLPTEGCLPPRADSLPAAALSIRCYAFVLVYPRPRRSTCLAMKNVGLPSAVYCEADAQRRYNPLNILLDGSANHLTGTHAVLDG